MPPKDEASEFQGKEFSRQPIGRGEYENCSFDRCTVNKPGLTGSRFVDCEFRNCDLSLAKTSGAALRNIRFIGCKRVGIRFDECNKLGFSVAFKGCSLKLSSFSRLNLRKTRFEECALLEVDFTEADLSGSVFENCDLLGAVFRQTVLEKVDFRTAYNYSIDPDLNRVLKARFSLVGVVGLLDKYDIVVE